MNKDNRTLQEVLEELKTISTNGADKAAGENAANAAASETVTPVKKPNTLDLSKLRRELESLREKVRELNSSLTLALEKNQEQKAEPVQESADTKEHVEPVKKRIMDLEREAREMKEYSDRLYDRIQDLRSELLKKQHVLDSVEELVKPLLDADSGADRHDVVEHILAVINEEKYSVSDEVSDDEQQKDV